MTVTTLSTSRRYSGLSSDTKPVRVGSSAVPAGSTFLETDTDQTWTFDGGRWWPPANTVVTSTIGGLIEEQNRILRGIRVGIAQLSGIDLTAIV